MVGKVLIEIHKLLNCQDHSGKPLLGLVLLASVRSVVEHVLRYSSHQHRVHGGSRQSTCCHI